MAYQVKEFELCHTPDNINNWLCDNPYNRVISSYHAGGYIGIIYETPDNDDMCATDQKADWIFSNPGPYGDEIFDWDKIEEALGFKLFYWQKTFIQRGEFRCYGKTTAAVLHNLLSNALGQRDTAFILTRSHRNSYEVDMYADFYKKLKEAGVPCRPLIVRNREE